MPSENTELTLAVIAKELKSRWRHIAVPTLSVTLLTAAWSMVMPHTYQATGSLMPATENKSSGLSGLLSSVGGGSAGGVLGALGGGGGSDSDVFADILRSRTVKLHILNNSGIDTLYPEIKEQLLEENLDLMDRIYTVEVNPNGFIFTGASVQTSILPNDEERRRAQRLSARIIGNAFAALDSINSIKTRSSARAARIFIERYLQANKDKLDSLQNVMEDFSRSNKILDLEVQLGSVVSNAVEIGSELAKTSVELDLARSIMTNDAPAVRELVEKKKTLTNQYEQVQKGGLVDNDGFSVPLAKLPELARAYFNLKRDIKILEEINVFLETQRTQEALREQRDTPTVTVLDEAIVPDKRVAPRRFAMTATAFLLSLFALVAWNIGKIVRTRTDS